MVVPIAGIVPAMIMSIPPSVISIPAAFPFCVQIAPLSFGLRTAFAVFADGIVQFHFRLLDFMLAFGVVVGISDGCSDKHRRAKGGGKKCCRRKFCKVLYFQSSLRRREFEHQV